MKKNLKKIILFLITGSIFFAYFLARSYENKITHPALTEQAAKLFNKTAEEKLSDQAIEWMKKGSIEEDNLPRPLNHFYDPIYKTALKEEINGIPAKTAINWAHSSISQTAYILTDDYTWEAAIYYYQNKQKEKAYVILGHILHLLEDMGVPAHVRDDAHITGDPYEKWAENYLKVNKLDVISGLSPNNCSSLDQCFSALAHYTNTNFFSMDTINSEKYKNPIIFAEKKEKVENETINYGYSSLNTKLARIKYSYDVWSDYKKPSYEINLPEIHHSYFSNLAPKVISYGAGLIKLFQEEVKKEQKIKPMSWTESKIEVAKLVLVEAWEKSKSNVVLGYNVTKDAAIYAGNAVKDAVISEYNKGKTVIVNEINRDKEVLTKIKGALIGNLENAVEVADSAKNVSLNTVKKTADSGLNALTVSTDKIGKILGEKAISINQESKKVAKQENSEAIKQENIKILKQEKAKDEKLKNTLPVQREIKKFEEGSVDGELVKVKHIIDGDTIELADGRRVRYIGIDTPELNSSGLDDDECLAWAARERNRILLSQSKDIRLIKDSGSDTDKYGRLLRYVYGNTLFISEVLAREGLAKFFICENYMKNCPVMEDAVRINKINSAAKEAQISKRGLYSDVCEKILKKEIKLSPLSNISESSPRTMISENSGSANKFIPLPGSSSVPILSVGKNEEDDSGTSVLPKEDGKNSDQEKDGGEPDEPKDLLPPITIMEDLAKEQNSSFAIYWKGEDKGDLLSGIHYYDLKYKINGTEWLDLETATTATSTIFNVNVPDDDGKEVCFQARAVDNAGNEESWPCSNAECEDKNNSIEQIKCSKINLTYPSKPILDYPKDGMTLVFDTITASGTAELTDVSKIVKVEINGSIYNALIQDNGIWTTEKPSLTEQGEKIILQKGVNAISAYVMEKDGDESEKVIAIVNVEEKSDDYLMVVINEVAWMGTSAANYNDEWMELYNNTGFPLDLTGWKLTGSDGMPKINLSGEIPSYGYYLLERTDDNVVKDIAANKIYTGDLNDNGEALELWDKDNNIIDYVDCSKKWYAGNKKERMSMERINPAEEGEEGNWASNDAIIKNGKNNNDNDIFGTPKSINSASVNNNILPNRMTVLPYSITENTTLTKDGNPYVIFAETVVEENATLNIGQGVIIKFTRDGRLGIKGSLNVKGAERRPVIFTSYNDDYYGGNTNLNNDQPQNGDWGWVSFEEGSRSSSIDNSIFQYGGYYWYKGDVKGEIWIKDGDVKITDSVFRKIVSAGSGVKIEVGKVEIKNSYFEGEASDSIYSDGIHITKSTSVLFDNLQFDDLRYGINYWEKMPVINAHNIWWGDKSGPFDGSDDRESGGFYNPEGKGVKVSDGVDYQNWLISLP